MNIAVDVINFLFNILLFRLQAILFKNKLFRLFLLVMLFHINKNSSLTTNFCNAYLYELRVYDITQDVNLKLTLFPFLKYILLIKKLSEI